VEKEGCDLERTPRLTSSAVADKNRAAEYMYVALGGRQGGAGQNSALTLSFFTSKNNYTRSKPIFEIQPPVFTLFRS